MNPSSPPPTARCFRTLHELVVHIKCLLALRQSSESTSENSDCKLAAVFDIDDTVVGQYDTYRLLNRTPGSVYRIHSICDLAVHCHKSGVAVFFVTARRDDELTNRITRAQLHEFGIHQDTYQDIYYRPATRDDIGAWKKEARQSIIARGYTIFLNTGDQWHDVSVTPDNLLVHHLESRQTNVLLEGHPDDTSVYHCKLSTFYPCSQMASPATVAFRVLRSSARAPHRIDDDDDSEYEFFSANETEASEVVQS